jgi:hypothetical protein
MVSNTEQLNFTSTLKLKNRPAFRVTWFSLEKTKPVTINSSGGMSQNSAYKDDASLISASIGRLLGKLNGDGYNKLPLNFVRFSLEGKEEITNIAQIESITDFRLEVIDESTQLNP